MTTGPFSLWYDLAIDIACTTTPKILIRLAWKFWIMKGFLREGSFWSSWLGLSWPFPHLKKYVRVVSQGKPSFVHSETKTNLWERSLQRAMSVCQMGSERWLNCHFCWNCLFQASGAKRVHKNKPWILLVLAWSGPGEVPIWSLDVTTSALLLCKSFFASAVLRPILILHSLNFISTEAQFVSEKKCMQYILETFFLQQRNFSHNFSQENYSAVQNCRA